MLGLDQLTVDDATFAFIVFTFIGFALLLLWLIEEVDVLRAARVEVLPPPSPLCRRVTGD